MNLNFPSDEQPATPAGIFSFWQGLFSKKQSSKPVSGQLIVVNRDFAKADQDHLVAPLYDLKLTCARRATALAKQGSLMHDMAEDYFAKVKVLDDQIDCLVELAEINAVDQDTPAWSVDMLLQLDKLQQEQSTWVQEGARCQNLASLSAQIADAYSKLVIELQICIYKTRNLPVAEAQSTANALFAAFQERCFELETHLTQSPGLAQESQQVSPPIAAN